MGRAFLEVPRGDTYEQVGLVIAGEHDSAWCRRSAVPHDVERIEQFKVRGHRLGGRGGGVAYIDVPRVAIKPACVHRFAQSQHQPVCLQGSPNQTVGFFGRHRKLTQLIKGLIEMLVLLCVGTQLAAGDTERLNADGDECAVSQIVGRLFIAVLLTVDFDDERRGAGR